MFLSSVAFWLSTLYSVRRYAVIYSPSRISKLTAQRHRSVVTVRPLISFCPTLLSLSATLSPAPGSPAPHLGSHHFKVLPVHTTRQFVQMYPLNSYSCPRR